MRMTHTYEDDVKGWCVYDDVDWLSADYYVFTIIRINVYDDDHCCSSPSV